MRRSVADDLKVGKVVAPQYFSCVTVLFSDIRGFTTLCSTSTPLQIVTFLNDLFSGFDEIISNHDAFKVSSIGTRSEACAILEKREPLKFWKTSVEFRVTLLIRPSFFWLS